MANIFSLYGSIFIDNEKANKSIDETTEKGKKSSSTFLESAGKIVKKSGEIGTAVVGATTAFVSGISAMAMGVADNAGAIDDAAKKVGTTAEEYQKWAYAAKLGGMETSKLESAMIKQQKAFSDAQEGSKSMITAYERLGINIKEVGSSGDAFNQVISALADMEDETTRNAIANDIFGKSYADLTPLLKEGSKGIDAWKQEAEDLGAVMSGDMLEAGANFGDTVDRIKTAFGGIYNQILLQLLPILEVFLKLILHNMPMIQDLISQLAPILIDALNMILPQFMQLIQNILPILIELIVQLLPFFTNLAQTLLPIIVQLLNLLLPPLLKLLEMILPILISLLQPLLPLLEPILNLLQPIIDLLLNLLQPLIELINLILPPIIELITNIINFILPPLQVALEYTADILTNAFNVAFENLTPVIENFKGYLQGIITFIQGVFSGDWKKAWEGIKQIFENIAGTFVNIFKTPINYIIDGLNKFVDWLNTIQIPDWVPGVGGKGFNFKHFDRLRHGLDYVPYDEYPALLHRGERVLTASENEAYAKGAGGITFNFYDTQVYDDRGIDMIMDKVVSRLRLEGAC